VSENPETCQNYVYFDDIFSREVDIMAIEAKLEGNKLVIICDLEEPVPSSSGKTLVVASTRGNMKTALTVNGKPLLRSG
jgi:hypothetical protein